MKLSSDQVRRLLSASQLISSRLELKELLLEVMTLAKEIAQVEATSILLLDENRQELVFYAATGAKGEALRETRMPLSQGIAGWGFGIKRR